MITCYEDYSPFKLEHEGILALGRAEQIGFRIDVDYCRRVEKHLERQIKLEYEEFEESDLAKKWRRTFAKVNYNSDTQLAKVVYEIMKIDPVKYTANGNPSTDEEALSALCLPEIDNILKIRQLDKAKNTYIGAFIREQVDGILHPSYSLHIPKTFRSSSQNPNFQNIPNRNPEIKKIIRKAIKARKGNHLLCADYGGIEVKVSACYHKDPNMITYILDESTDMHRDTAADCFLLDLEDAAIKGIRHTAKNMFVFPQFYGDWYKSCAKGMWNHAQHGKNDTHVLKNGLSVIEHLKKRGIKNYEAFEEHIRKVEDKFWNVRFPVYKQWKEDWWNDYCKRGYIDMYTGFRCHAVMERNDCINYPVQGAAFHCLLLAFVIMDYIQDERGWVSRLIGQIHDEIIMDVYPPEAKEVIATLEWVMTKEVPRIFKWINVPLIVEMEMSPVDGSWYDKTKIDKKLLS